MGLRWDTEILARGETLPCGSPRLSFLLAFWPGCSISVSVPPTLLPRRTKTVFGGSGTSTSGPATGSFVCVGVVPGFVAPAVHNDRLRREQALHVGARSREFVSGCVSDVGEFHERRHGRRRKRVFWPSSYYTGALLGLNRNRDSRQ